MKFCKKCKKEVKDDALFCPFCGGALEKDDNKKDGNPLKTCNKCNKDFPAEYKRCPYCGGALVDKNLFWNNVQVLGHVPFGNNQRIKVEKVSKNGNEFVSIGKQFFDSSIKDYRYKKSIAVPISCIKDLILILGKVK